MRRLSLTSLLILINAGLLLVVVVGVAAGAVRVLRQLADRHALARVDLAAQGAAAAIERAGDRVLASARLAADRPALGRLLPGGDRAALGAWLERFRRTSELTGCALFAGGRRLASAGPPLPWEALRPAPPGRRLVTGAGGTLFLVGSAPLAGAAQQVEAVTVLALDESYARRLGRQVGLAVAVLDAGEAGRASAPAAAVREQALAAGGPGGAGGVGAAGAAGAAGATGVGGAAARIDAADLYVADRPLLGPGGEVRGVVEARLPTASVDGSLSSLIERLLLLALSVAALAIVASAAAGRWLGRPVRALTTAAARLGRGDLTTPIERAPGLELGALAATLEETRRQLLRLTAELRRRQAEGEAVLTGMAEGVLSVDRDRRIRYLNPQAAALLGVREEQALGRFCGDVLKPRGMGGVRPCEDSCPIVHARFRGSARAAEPLLLAGGRQRTVIITSAAPVEERQFLVLRDETDLEVARRQRDAVLANISHEFKTPLAAQRASLELLREKLLDPEAGSGAGAAAAGGTAAGAAESAEIQDLVLSLERGGLRLAQLIDNLLESVRIESGRDSVRKRPVALDEVVEEAVELTAPLFAQRRQRVEVELPFPLPAVLGDAPRLTQVFVNLLANAHKFAPAGSPLGVGGEVTERAVTLWVDDQGPGLPATADSGRELFRRFVRSPGEMGEPEQSGMGLGLWIVQSIVERHGGSVEAERRNPGMRMRVTLPLAAAGEDGKA
jgi:signal transduction histidine kinase/HAMP domain-containing protein